ncbi:hypothetical protein predicted by Glimmer/Critica [Acetobacter ghanensis]|uniref:Uncharacterized protein n=1 Tax=Acetobacter ghanensis TaxID=431306 RepID=A0A0U5F4V7_9PROT|nr:hypothetical protein predicted by Glimmer/Critica [Acetobacter ghanensis]
MYKQSDAELFLIFQYFTNFLTALHPFPNLYIGPETVP